MNKNIWAVIFLIAVVAVLAIVLASQNDERFSMMENKSTEAGNMMEEKKDTMMKDTDSVMEEKDAMMKSGSYEAYSPEKLALAERGDVVLFFRASWCPTCRALDADIKANMKNIPAGVAILDVDYDNSTALRQRYGVTYQHTLVQVDKNGNQIAEWLGSPTLASLISNIK